MNKYYVHNRELATAYSQQIRHTYISDKILRSMSRVYKMLAVIIMGI